MFSVHPPRSYYLNIALVKMDLGTILNGSQMIEYSPTAVFEKNKRIPITDAGTAVYNVVMILSLGKTA